MNDVPGRAIVRVFGEVAGLTVRCRSFASNSMCRHALSTARTRSSRCGFDCNEIAGTMSEVAYGTAVLITPVA
ncbi:hypothetical protein IU450_29395 [Nocardia abscessus]|uniref:hypothetical protein n=1 Tax=Nocardia abscessus TaxID=120957 RepID=UPI0018949086|nr:hypothetical protein [Nocardia abscessus]MBF6339971.1 hypothetical protein [Nocardia abscessus]